MLEPKKTRNESYQQNSETKRQHPRDYDVTIGEEVDEVSRDILDADFPSVLLADFVPEDPLDGDFGIDAAMKRSGTDREEDSKERYKRQKEDKRSKDYPWAFLRYYHCITRIVRWDFRSE